MPLSKIDQEILEYRQASQQKDLDLLLKDVLRVRHDLGVMVVEYAKACQLLKQSTLRFRLENAPAYQVFYTQQLKTASILAQSLKRSERTDGLVSPAKEEVLQKTKERVTEPYRSLLPDHDDLDDLYGEVNQ